MLRSRVAVWALFVAVGCTSGNPGNDDAGSDGGGGEDGSCDIALTGALTGDFDCRSVSLLYRSDDEEFTFAMDDEDSDAYVILASWEVAGEPAASTPYALASSSVKCTVTVNDGNKRWEVKDTASPAGDCSLTFTIVTEESTAGLYTSYLYQGTLTATLPANTLTPATGEVQLSATFQYP